MAYQQIRLYCMSGTGNSYRAATWMQAAAQAYGVQGSVCPLSEINDIASHQASNRLSTPLAEAEQRGGELQTLLGLIFPTHGFTAPWAVIRAVWRLPSSPGAHALVVPTRGGTKFWSVIVPGLEGTAGYLIALLLWLKGYAVRGIMGLDMPVNWIAVHSALHPDKVKAISAKAQKNTERFMNVVLSGKRYWGGLLPLFFGLLLLPVSFLYLLIGRFFLAKLFFANTHCNSCGLCAKHCPFQAILMKGPAPPRPYWTYSCESCMRCMAYCPTRAVEAGHSWGILLFYLAHAPIVAYLLYWAGKTWGIAVDPNFLLEYAYKLFSMAAAYFVFDRLIRTPAVNKLFTWTTFTHLFRRYHEPETALRDLGD